MGKNKDKEAKADKNTDKKEKAAEREFKFGVDDLAEALGLQPASVRVQLRNKGIEKAGKSYGWNSKKDLDEVIAQIKTEPKEKKASKKNADEKPAKDKKAKKEKKDK